VGPLGPPTGAGKNGPLFGGKEKKIGLALGPPRNKSRKIAPFFWPAPPVGRGGGHPPRPPRCINTHCAPPKAIKAARWEKKTLFLLSGPPPLKINTAIPRFVAPAPRKAVSRQKF